MDRHFHQHPGFHESAVNGYECAPELVPAILPRLALAVKMHCPSVNKTFFFPGAHLLEGSLLFRRQSTT